MLLTLLSPGLGFPRVPLGVQGLRGQWVALGDTGGIASPKSLWGQSSHPTPWSMLGCQRQAVLGAFWLEEGAGPPPALGRQQGTRAGAPSTAVEQRGGG